MGELIEFKKIKKPQLTDMDQLILKLKAFFLSKGMPLNVVHTTEIDGKTYKFGIRTDDAVDGVQYQARFATQIGEWQDIRLPIHEFQPTFRGRTVQAPSLDPARIKVFGLLIADRQAGPFRLVVESIQAQF